MPRPTPTLSGIARSRRWVGFACACVVVILLKLWLIAPDEVVARANPYDQLRYAGMAQDLADGRWLGDYGPRTLIREPSYPVWIALARAVGVPLRDATEGLLVVAALAFGAALLRIGLPAWLASASVAWLVLQPHSVLANREVLPAGFYLPTLLIAVSGLLLASRAPRTRSLAGHALWAGLALGIVWTTRPEKAIAGLVIALAGSVAFFVVRSRGGAWRGAVSSAALLVGVATAGVALVSGMYAAINFSVYGIPVTSDLQAPGYVAANRALLSIEHASPRRFVPVPADVRARAYAASPAFRELRPFLETPGWGHHASCISVRVCDDLAGGWFLWIFREAAAAAGHMKSAPEAEAFFATIAAEIGDACERGALGCRPGLLPFLHPAAGAWAPSLPGSLGEVATSLVAPRERTDPIPGLDDPAASAAVLAHFDAVAGRERIPRRRAAVVGRVRSFRDPVLEVRVSGDVGPVEVSLGPESTGADGVYERTFAFDFELPRPAGASGGGDGGALLEVTRASGALSSVALSTVIHDEVEIDGVRISASATPAIWESVRTRLWNGLWSLQPWLLGGLALASLAGALRLLVQRHRPSLSDPALSVFVLTGALVAARVLMLAMVDASSFNATSSRYVYPAAALAGCALLAWIHVAFGAPSLGGRTR